MNEWQRQRRRESAIIPARKSLEMFKQH
jgi:hypothetical protein